MSIRNDDAEGERVLCERAFERALHLLSESYPLSEVVRFLRYEYKTAWLASGGAWFLADREKDSA
jgi:hypothetical protein